MYYVYMNIDNVYWNTYIRICTVHKYLCGQLTTIATYS